MIEGLRPEPHDTIVELGPGTGAFTGAIRRALPEPSGYLGIEIDAGFVEILRSEYPDLEFVHGSAEDLAAILRERRRDNVYAVLSGLPFASLPQPVQDRILTSLDDVLAGGAVFRTFQYVHAFPLPKARRFRAAMRERFGECQVMGPVVRNLPPAFVLSWTGAKR